MDESYIKIHGLKKYYPYKTSRFNRKKEWIRAVDGIDLTIAQGKTFGLVGESGCGKSTVGKLIIRLINPTAGSVYIEGTDILKLPKADLKRIRRNVQIIFQDPFGSLDPNMRIGDIIAEPFITHEKLSKAERQNKVATLLELVGLDADDAMKRFPHEFSGGQRQRISIARAIALHPKFVICDEAVSALDVSIQAQIINLLKSLQQQLDLTYLFISHNLSVIHHISDIVGVMYLGKMVEIAPADIIFYTYRHPYTEALITAIPKIGVEEQQKRILLHDEIPDPLNLPSGCRFHTRCLYRTEICSQHEPELCELEPNCFVACHHPLPRRRKD